jgi:uncharacterized membrane protein
MRALAIAGLLMLAACGSTEKAEEPKAAPSPKGAHLGEISLSKPLRATDNALTWSLEVAPGSITLTRFAGRGSEGDVSQFYPVSPKVEGDDKAVWQTRDTLDQPVTITFTNARCIERGAPKIERPLIAELKIADKVFHGCAGLRPAPEPSAKPAEGGNVSADNVAETAGNSH